MALYTIQAKDRGTVLPWVLKPQDAIVVRWTAGSWTCNPNVGPGSYDANGNPSYSASGVYLYPGAYEGRLIACVGNVAPVAARFPVGNYGIVKGVACQLWVACNDDWNAVAGRGYADNQGAITIEVVYARDFLPQLKSDEEIFKLYVWC